MSDYTGHVEPGGPASSRLVRTADAEVEVRKLSVGPMDNNAYLLRDTASGRALLVDAANEADRLLAELADVTLEGIVTTHGHRDHWQAVQRVAAASDAPVWLHPGDRQLVPWEPDVAAVDGEEIHFGDARVGVMHTPGHTDGSVCLLLGNDHLLSGDTLFPGGPGRVATPEEFATIMRSLDERLFTLPDETWVYPGHGDDTTLGTERPHLPAWRARGW